MSLFAWLLVGHLVGDFLLQTEREAVLKTSDAWVRFHHVVYWLVAVFAAAFLYLGSNHLLTTTAPNERLVALVFMAAILHFLQDDRRLVLWWLQRVKMTARPAPWLVIVVDQVFHVVTLAAVAALAT